MLPDATAPNPDDRTASLGAADAERTYAAARDRVFGPYRDLEPIGGGSSGAVFRAVDRRDGSVVALKVLAPGSFATPDELLRFRREPETLARLSHPGIARLREAGEVEGRPYFATEFIDGEPLSRVLARPDHPFREPARAAALVREVCLALACAHALGIVHRDVKPSNIVLGTDGRPRVTDFGLARDVAAEARTRAGQVMGTPAYMAPEQARGELDRVDARSDVYALGAVLYEMATGRPPFQGAGIADLVQRVAHELPPAPREVAPQVPSALEAICLMAMDPDPSRRYAEAGAMGRDLERFLSGGRPEALSRRRGALRRRFVARHRTALLIASAVAATAFLAWGWASQAARRAQDERVARTAREVDELLARGDLAGAWNAADSLLAHEPDREEPRELLARVERRARSDIDEVLRAIEAGLPVPRRRIDLLLSLPFLDPELSRRLLGEPERPPVRLSLDGLPADAEIRARRISPEDLTIAAEAIPFPEDGLLARGGWVIEIRAGGLAPLRVPVELVGETRVRVDLPPQSDVPEGMVVISGGPALLGGEAGGPEIRDVPTFLIDRVEVTRREYARFLEAARLDRPRSWPEGTLDGEAGLLPATDVSWDEARRFAEWAGKRLPTAEEWEKAGRGVDGRPYPWGRLRSRDAANVETAGLEPVGSRSGDASPYGVLDLCGNAMEWTATPWPGEEGLRTIRGNSHAHRHLAGQIDLDHLAHAARGAAGFRAPYVGFRCAKDLPRR